MNGRMEKERKYEMSAEAIIRLEGLGKQFLIANGTV